MKFDEVVSVLGEFGPYQKRIYFLLCLPAITGCIQMSLVCEDKARPAVAQMVLFSGSTFASISCQPPSDIFGRKKMLMFSILVHAVVSLAITWSKSFSVLCVYMFLTGAAVTTCFANAFVIGMELVGPSKRVWAGIVMEIFWSMGMILLAPVAFLLRDWQHLQLATSILPFGFLSYYWLIPESPRWLISRGRIQEAEAIIRTAAKVNKVILPASVLDAKSLVVEKRESVFSICKHPNLVFRCVVIFYSWFVSSLAFYGLGLNVGKLSGSVYVNFLLSGVMETVAYILCLCLLDRLGRRLLNAGLMLLAGLTCTLTVLTLLYAPHKLFPTVVRGSGMGVSAFVGRIGSVISPYIAGLSTVIDGDVGTATPLLIFGLSSILAGCLLLTLPETLNRKMPETVNDAINYTR
nr:hypothetical protein BaRGS_013771 [Batillaria attramentaria]